MNKIQAIINLIIALAILAAWAGRVRLEHRVARLNDRINSIEMSLAAHIARHGGER